MPAICYVSFLCRGYFFVYIELTDCAFKARKKILNLFEFCLQVYVRTCLKVVPINLKMDCYCSLICHSKTALSSGQT